MNSPKLVWWLAFVAVVVACFLAPQRAAYSAVVTWNGPQPPDLTWLNSANWSPAQAPVEGDELVFGATGSAASSAITNIVSATTPNYLRLTYKALVGSPSGGYHTTEIAAGQTLNLTGDSTVTNNILYVGNTDAVINANSQVYARITGAGTLKIDNAYNILLVKQAFGADGTHTATLDMSGLNEFNCALVGKIRIGYAAGNDTNKDNRATGTLKLAKTNFIKVEGTADDDFVIGYHTDNAGTSQVPSLLLGETNTIYSDRIIIGSRKTGGYIGFNTEAGFVNPKVKFRGKAGFDDTRMARFSVGDDYSQSNATNATSAAAADFTAGEIDALITDLWIGRSTRGNSASAIGTKTGVMSFDKGVVDVNNLYIGIHAFNASSAGNAFGTLNVGGDSAESRGTLIVNTQIEMGRRVTTTSTTIPEGTLNLTGYALAQVKGDIFNTRGGTSTLRIADNATLDMLKVDGSTKGTIAVTNLKPDGGTIKNVASLTVDRIVLTGTAATSFVDFDVNATHFRGIGGNGTWTQALALETGGAGVSPGNAGIAGTVNTPGGLDLSSGAGLNFDLANATTVGGGVNDLLVTGDLTLNNNTLAVTFAPNQQPTAGNVYRIVNYTGTKLGSLNSVVASQTRYTFTLDETTAGQINLTVVGGAPATLTWNGTSSTAWEVGGATNWLMGTPLTSTSFQQLDDVVIDDTVSGVLPSITIAAGVAVQPYSIVANIATSTEFIVSDAGKITGSTGIVKNGAGKLSLATANDFTGPVQISAGILKVSSVTALGTAAAGTTIAAGATLEIGIGGSYLVNLGEEEIIVSGKGVLEQGAIINLGADSPYALRKVTLNGDTTFGGAGRWDIRKQTAGTSTVGVLAGNGHNLTKVGLNQVTLADLGDTGLGDITVSEGTLQFEAGSTMGNSANSVTVASGATLGFENSTVIHNKVTFLNGGILDNKRSWDLAAVPPVAMPLTYGAPTTAITLGAGTTSTIRNTNANEDQTFIIAGKLQGSGNLILANPARATSVIELHNNNTCTGETTIASGTVKLVSTTVNNNIAASPLISIDGGATLDVTQVTTAGGFILGAGQTLAGGTYMPANVLGAVTTAAGARVAPGGLGLPGTLTLQDLNLVGGDTLEFDLGADNTSVGSGYNDLLYAANVTRSGTTTIKINPLATLASGAYTLMYYSTLGAGSFNVISSDPLYSFTLSGSGGMVTVTPSAVVVATWNADVAGTGDWNVDGNWAPVGVPANGARLIFSGSTTPARLAMTHNATGLTSVSGLKFAATAGNFTLGGAALSVAGKIEVENDPATTAKTQTLNVGVTLAAGPNQGVIDVQDEQTTLGLTQAVGGTVGLTKAGPGIVELTAASNGYTGPTVVAQGTLRVTAGVDSAGAGPASGDDTTVGTTGPTATTATLITGHIRQDTLTINPGSKVEISTAGGPSGTSVVNFLQIANTDGTFNWGAGGAPSGSGMAPAGLDAPGSPNAAAVPEPATWLLAAIAMAMGLLCWRRRR